MHWEFVINLSDKLVRETIIKPLQHTIAQYTDISVYKNGINGLDKNIKIYFVKKKCIH